MGCGHETERSAEVRQTKRKQADSPSDKPSASPVVAAEPFFFGTKESTSTGSNEGRLPEGEFVIGVEVDGRAKAYPMSVMSCEIGNDTFNGEPIAVSW